MPKIELLNCDCMQFMATLPDKAFDLAIVDPPYGIGEHGGKVRFGVQSKNRGFTAHKEYAKKGWDNKCPNGEYFQELFRTSRNQIIFGANHFGNMKPSPCWIVWDKKGTDKSDFADCELAWTSFSTCARLFRYSWVGFGYINKKETKIHPTQKPVALYDWILRNYAKPGQRILDTHLGSGSSAIAAHYFGCDFVGCEIDESYFLAAKERFERETKQITLFGAEGDQPQCDKADKDTGDYQNDLRF